LPPTFAEEAEGGKQLRSTSDLFLTEATEGPAGDKANRDRVGRVVVRCS
jgi:hypothetical protein